MDKDGFGLGVVNAHVTEFLGGFSGAKGTGGPHDSPAGYIAPIKAVQLGPEADFSFTSHVVLGNLEDIRAYAVDAVACAYMCMCMCMCVHVYAMCICMCMCMCSRGRGRRLETRSTSSYCGGRGVAHPYARLVMPQE